MKRNVLVAAILALLAAPVIVMAVDADRFVMSRPQLITTDVVVVPLDVSNTKDLVALDIPLGFSEGAVLEKVEFTDLVKKFDFQIATINNDKRQVLIGLITMGNKDKPDLSPGSGTIANMYFKLDPGTDMVEITPIELSNPGHSLTYYYNDYSNGYPEVKTIQPQVETIRYSLPPGGAVPDVYTLNQNFPNPFNPTTRISYASPEAGQVRLTVFNILGQDVCGVVDEYAEAGAYDVVWDGRDNSGVSVASGIYFYRIEVNNFSETKKMLLLK